MPDSADDDARWAEASSLLDRTPVEAPHRQEARDRYDRRAVRFAVVLPCVAAAAALVLFAVDPQTGGGEPPTWRVVTGIAISVLGLVLMGARLARPYGSRPRTADPLGALTRQQRAELHAHVRGGAPVPPDMVPLVRRQAEWLLEQRTALFLQAGLTTVYLGVWIVHRTVFSTLLALGFAAATGVAGLIAVRDARRARRFLAGHPAPRDS